MNERAVSSDSLDNEFNQVQSLSVILLKGAGAITGIREKFATNLVTVVA